MSTSKSSKSPAALEPDLRRACELVMQLMPIRGRSGEEREVAEFISGKLRKAGVPADSLVSDNAHQKALIKGNQGNLILRLPGTLRLPRRMLTAHLDTVPICQGSEPKRVGDRVRSRNPETGLGADNRAGAAVLLNTALEILGRKLPHPPLTFCWFIQEEVGLFGARFLQKSLLGNPRLVFNWDGGSPSKLTIGATGAYRLDIHIRGLASHAGGAPEKGVSAIAIAALAIADLQREGWHGKISRRDGQGTSNVGVIAGGEATNVVTDHVHLRAEARSHDPEFRVRIVDEFEAAFQRAAQSVVSSEGKSGSVQVTRRMDYESFRLPQDEPCVVAAEAAVQAVGLTPERAISNGGLDANWMTARGLPAVTLGCGQVSPHTVDEALDVLEFQHACRIALRLATASEG
ncbi:MAG: M20/M25/M40 family metallo-hydrolase [Pirellulales bacterium]